MTLRPKIEALLQGALDGSLSADDRRTLDLLLATDPSVRARAAQLEQLSAVLESVGQVDLPPTFAADVLATIQASTEPARVVEFSRSSQAASFPGERTSDFRGGVAMNKKIIWGLAAAAVLVLAVVGYVANPSVNQGTEATIGTAQRYQAPQIDSKDVAVGDTSVQALLQTETWDAIRKDETLRTLLQDANVRARLQDAELRQALSDAELMRALRSPNLAKALADPEIAKRLNDADLMRKLNDPELAKKLNDAELLKKLVDPDLQTALSNKAFAAALADTNVRARLADANVLAALAGPAFQAALRDAGFAAALRQPNFAEAMGRAR